MTATGTIVVTLTDPTRYQHQDSEDGQFYPVDLPAGAAVLTTGRHDRGYAFVPGVARPTMHGGGVHTTVRDPNTGTAFRAIVDAYVDRTISA